MDGSHAMATAVSPFIVEKFSFFIVCRGELMRTEYKKEYFAVMKTRANYFSNRVEILLINSIDCPCAK